MQSGKKGLAVKALVALLTVASLALIVLKPMRQTTEKKGTAILLTKGFDEKQRDSLRVKYKGITELLYDKNKSLARPLDSINSIFVLGEGVQTYDLWQLENQKGTYLPGKQPTGITRLKYEREATAGDSLIVEGLYDTAQLDETLVLQDAGGNGIDSTLVNETGKQNFKLKGSLAASGNYVYKVVAKDSAGTRLRSEPIPIAVKEKKILEILIVNTFPTFETKYLKNFLAENGHRVLVRSQLTKGKFKFENFNRERGTVYGFSRENLSSFDLVILDVASYVGLSRSSTKGLEDAVWEDGLGVFIQPEDGLFMFPKRVRNKLSRKRSDFNFNRSPTDVTRLARWPKIAIPTYRYAFKETPLLQTIHTPENQVVSAYTASGLGRIGTTAFKDTYQLVLNGNAEVYQYIWSSILSEMGKIENLGAQFNTKLQLTYPDEPFRFSLRTHIPAPKVYEEQGMFIALKGNPNLPEVWQGRTYPKNVGWNTLRVQQDSTAILSYYVSDPSAWSSIRGYATSLENQKFFNTAKTDDTSAAILLPISRFWLLLIFVCGMGFLWLVGRR